MRWSNKGSVRCKFGNRVSGKHVADGKGNDERQEVSSRTAYGPGCGCSKFSVRESREDGFPASDRRTAREIAGCSLTAWGIIRAIHSGISAPNAAHESVYARRTVQLCTRDLA